MAPSRNRALIRILALFLLLWVGFDVGAHGLLASDFAPPPARGIATRLSCGDHGGHAPLAPDHCFCHGISIGAVLPGRAEGLAPANAIAPAPPDQVGRSDRDPLDHPPQLTA